MMMSNKYTTTATAELLRETIAAAAMLAVVALGTVIVMALWH